MAKKSQKDTSEEQSSNVETELNQIKRLLVLLLLKSGATQNEIAKTLGIGQASVSRQYNLGKLKPIRVEKTSGTGTL